ncbi:hypothetical protein MHU86_25876 [Fragilaria crotonensis]|nr:hypothetical protein MHU86_25876 [Fragilaria crotonensis]
MKSSLFSDAKCNASLGRNTTSRQAIKERKESVAARSSTPQQHTMAMRPQQSLTARQQSDMLVELRHATKDVMQKTYELFEAEFVEKEQQKTAFLEVRIIRDNLASLTRKQDLLLQKYYHSTKGPIQNQMKTDLDRLEAQIAELETSLRILQETELHRRKKAKIAPRHGVVADVLVATDPDASETTKSGNATASSPAASSASMPRMVSIPCEDSGLAVAFQESITICTECNEIPTKHVCRKCKQFVCDLCCSEKRGLELVWWCGTCFDDESLSNQRQIRDGKYESDGE